MKKIKRNVLLNPGPATTTDSVKFAQVVPDICPREREFGAILLKINKDLVKIVKGGRDFTSVLFAGSGTAAMDACINSVVPKNAKIAIISNGLYGDRMIKIARSYQIPCVEINFEWDQQPDLKKVEEMLMNDRKITYLVVVHHETTTGILNPIREIGVLAKKYGCTFIVDAVSSFAGIPINVKDCHIDFMFSTSNKCIQGVAGLSFIVCRIKSVERLKGRPKRSFYLDLYSQYDFYKRTGQMQFTPPVQVVYALKQAIAEYFEEGDQTRYRRYTKSWSTLRKGMNEIGFKFLLKKQEESHILTTIVEPKDPNYDFNRMHDLLYEEGFTIYPGKMGKKKTFRIANMGAIDHKDIEKFLAAVKRTLNRMNIKMNKCTTREGII